MTCDGCNRLIAPSFVKLVTYLEFVLLILICCFIVIVSLLTIGGLVNETITNERDAGCDLWTIRD